MILRKHTKKELEAAKKERRLSLQLLESAHEKVIDPLRKIDRENNFGDLVDELLKGRRLHHEPAH